MRIVGLLLIVTALVIGIVPAFNNCSYEGKMLTTTNGKQVPMRCFWTARAGIGTAIPLAAVGLFIAVDPRKRTLRALGVTGGLLSAVAFALPTTLIGVCSMGARCETVAKPSLMAAGLAGLALSGVAVAVSFRNPGAAEADKADV